MDLQCYSRLLLLLVTCLAFPAVQAATEAALSLEGALATAYTNNPELQAFRLSYEAEQALVRERYWPDDPQFGVMYENDITLMEIERGPMAMWTVNQGLLFPTKYFLAASAQKHRAQAEFERAQRKQLQIRTNVISTYYRLLTVNQVVAHLEAQRGVLRALARTVEARRATGKVPQQDEMKIHVEQTRLESDMVLVRQERESLEAALKALMGLDADAPIVLPKAEPEEPQITADLSELWEIARTEARQIRTRERLVEEAEAEKSLANASYLPDFSLGYRRAFVNSPPGAYAVTAELSVPLWFFGNQVSLVRSSRARLAQAQRMLESERIETQASLSSLRSEVAANARLLKIYRTTLIPQLQTTFRSSQAAYRAGQISVIELLDSERALYEVRIAFFRLLADYVRTLASLEELVGASLSSLPFGGES